MAEDKKNLTILDEAMTKEEKKAALDALMKILNAGGQGNDDQNGSGSGAGGGGPQITQEFADAWNKIMEKYDNDNYSKDDLTKLLQDILDNNISEL